MGMELIRFRELSPDVYREYPLEEWSSSLRSVCGNFQSKPCDEVRRVTGRVHPSTAGGIEFVQVANDLATIRRELPNHPKGYGKEFLPSLPTAAPCRIPQPGPHTYLWPRGAVLGPSSRP